MKLHRLIAQLMGYELINRKKSHDRYFLHLLKLVYKYNIQTVLDVGANVGQYASELRRYGYKGRIISFEPLKGCFTKLEALAKKDPLWEVYNFALGDRDAEEKIQVPTGCDFASFHTVNEYAHTQFSHRLQNLTEETVQIRDFNRWLSQNSEIFQGASFLKLDTQGYDLPILKAAIDFLPRMIGVSTELSFKPLYNQMPSYMEVMVFLQNNLYATSNIFPVSRDHNTFELIEADGVFLNTRKVSF